MDTRIFTELPVRKAVIRLALPTMMGMIVTMLYNLADTFFVGQTGDPNQVAAVSLTMPIYLVLMALGNVFGVGGGSLVSRLLGAGEAGRSKNVSSSSFVGCVLAGLLFSISVLALMDPLLAAIGTSPGTLQYAKDYLRYIAYGAPLVVLSFAFGGIIRAEGAATESMIGMLIGTIVNIVLDPLMITTMGMGVSGAAIATIIGNACSVAYYTAYIRLSRKTVLSIRLEDFSLQRQIWTEILSIGLPASLTNLLMSAANVALNVLLAGHGDRAVAAMGIAGKCFLMPVLLLTGLGQGLQPFVGYAFAAKNYGRMSKAIRFAALASVVMGSALSVLLFAFSSNLIGLFIRDGEVIELGSRFLRALISPGPVLGVFFVLTFVFQSIGLALPSLILSISRQGLIFVPALFIGNSLFGLEGIVWSQPIADLVSLLLSVILFERTMRGLKLGRNAPAGTRARQRRDAADGPVS